MKKLFFLLLVFLVGFGVVFAGTIAEQPPGAFAEVASPMTEFGIHEGIDTQSMVLVEITQSSIKAIHSPMYELARETKNKVDMVLSHVEGRLLEATTVDIYRLSPHFTCSHCTPNYHLRC